MKSFVRRRLSLVLLLVCLSAGAAWARDNSQASVPAQAQPADQKAQQQPAQPVGPDAAIGRDLTNASKEAVKSAEGEGEEHEEYPEFKYSAMVARLGSYVGLGPRGMYWLSMAVNFIILALFFWMLLKSRLPQMFRNRTELIQKALTEAKEASAEASRRLSDIEARLSKLDVEVNEIRAAAERDAAVEEERVRTAAEEDKHRVVESAEAEIAAIARGARHDLKSFAASLAVDIASHKIKVDDNTDQALVRHFVSQLGKDGQ